MLFKWIKGILHCRFGRLTASVLGIAITIALLASIGTFISYSGASMTKRAIENVAIDWQIQMTPGADEQAVADALSQSAKYTALEKTGYADTAGFQSSSAEGTVQVTGPGKVLGISPDFSVTFPGEVRLLTGSGQGVLVAQQTAANLHIKLGDKVTIERVGLPSVDVNVDGVIDLPNADSLFQAIGLPAGAAPQAPPDNVLLVPIDLWHQLFDEQAIARPDSVRMQIHVKLDHTGLSASPDAAYKAVQQQANNLEARIAGSGIIGNNLAARLGTAREDALYAGVLFLFLGFPGTLLAIWLTLFIAGSGTRHRQREQSVLRMHGASIKQILRLESIEAVILGFGGVLLGVALAYITISISVPSDIQLGVQWVWIAAAAVLGIALALFGTLYPAWRLTKKTTMEASKEIGIKKKPFWQRYYLDYIMLVIAGVEFWRTASTGYQVVLAPEGVTAVSVNYESFLAPLFLWLGGVFLAIRLIGIYLDKGRKPIEKTISPFGKKLSPLIVASMSRDRKFLLKGIIFVALAVSFAVSTSIFNTTYNAQAVVDAELTNGADVNITAVTPFVAGDNRLEQIQSLSGIAGVQLMQHRFAYVGSDLQDMYGIDPAHITEATNISNAFFGNGDATATLNALKNQEDAVLVSEETVQDFQLQPGDQLNLRLQDAADNQYHVVTFHFAGVVREFPTAPTDSFLVANAGYIAKMTHNDSYEVALLKAAGSAQQLAKDAEAAIGTQYARITDIGTAQRVINSSLTSVDMRGLTGLELVFAVILIGGAMGLVLAMGLGERKRNFAILEAVGAKSKQRNAFIWGETLMMLSCGTAVGIALGFGVAAMLVKVLTGVFDPPPEVLSVPWGYLAIMLGSAAASAVIAVQAIKKACKRPLAEMLKDI